MKSFAPTLALVFVLTTFQACAAMSIVSCLWMILHEDGSQMTLGAALRRIGTTKRTQDKRRRASRRWPYRLAGAEGVTI